MRLLVALLCEAIVTVDFQLIPLSVDSRQRTSTPWVATPGRRVWFVLIATWMPRGAAGS